MRNNHVIYISSRHFKKGLACILCFLLAAGLLCGCQEKKTKKSDHKVRVETRTVERGTLEISSDYIGTLAPNISINVVPFVSATVEEVHVKVGDHVKSGQVLCQLDDTAAELSVKSAEDAVKSAKAGKDAAGTQTESARLQANSSVKTLENTLKSYKDALKTARAQKKKLRNSRSGLTSAQDTAKNAYSAAKTRYKTAEALLIQFEAFLNNNPDCRTTAGLTAAATSLPAAGPGSSEDPSLIPGLPAESGADPAGSDPDGSLSDGSGGQDSGTGLSDDNTSQDDTSPGGSGSDDSGISGGSGSDDSSGTVDDPAKRKQAQALLTALTQAGLTVEYLSATGIKSLKENVDDGETAFNGAAAGLSQLDTSIATIDSNISQLKAQISATQDSLDQARKMADLADAGTDVYDAQIEAAETGVEAAKYQQDMYRLTSPIDGVVEDVTVKKDNMAAQGVAAFTIVEKESMAASFYVTEEVSHFLKIGDPVDVVTDDGKQEQDPNVNAGMAAGHITMIASSADPMKGLFKVEAEILSVGRIHLSGGTSVKLSLVSNAVDNQLLIPYDSVYYDNGQAYVYRLKDDKAVRTDITTGIFNQEYIVVTDGLNEGESLVTTWASGLKDGAKVEIAQ